MNDLTTLWSSDRLDQVLDGQTPHIQRFLIQTSILGDAVIASQGTHPDASFTDSQEVLEYLKRLTFVFR